MDEPAANGGRVYDHEGCDHSTDLDSWCATLRLVTRWPRIAGGARLRRERSRGIEPIRSETLLEQLKELNELARRALD